MRGAIAFRVRVFAFISFLVSLSSPFGLMASGPDACQIDGLRRAIANKDWKRAQVEFSLLAKRGCWNEELVSYGNLLSAQGRLCPDQQRELAMAQALLDREGDKENLVKACPKEGKTKGPWLEVKGRVRMAVAMESDGDLLWKYANPDKESVPYEKSWRYLWGDERENTFDPKVYDRLQLELHSTGKGPEFYTKFVLDPWSYVGDVDVHVEATAGGDEADVRLKYIYATGRTMNEIFRTKYGNVLNFDEIKVNHGRLSPYTPEGLYDWYTYFEPIGGEKVHTRWNLIRDLWVAWANDFYEFKLFPISDQSQALTSDDPLRLSNNKRPWEESPWIDTYDPSRVFARSGNPLKGGKWVRNISAYVRDSDWNRLTYLRGARLALYGDFWESETVLAFPMTLWDDWTDLNSGEMASRWKLDLDSFPGGFVGLTYTGKRGFDADEHLEAKNDTIAVDLLLPCYEGVSLKGEIGYSWTRISEANGFLNSFHGYAYAGGFEWWPIPKRQVVGAYGAYMDDTFNPGLSNYRYTRKEEERTKHLYFDPLPEEITADYYLAYGDGMERGRRVFGIYSKGLFPRWDYDFYLRKVDTDSGDEVETLVRAELGCRPKDWIAVRGLFWYKFLPDTKAGKDPLLLADNVYALSDYYSGQVECLQNNSISEGEDPSIGHFSGGIRVGDEKLNLEGIWERTNDPMDFPRLLFYDTYVTDVSRDGILWDAMVPFLYDQDIFGLPPYDYYDIFRVKLSWRPVEWLEVRGSFTRNENKFATGIDDNVNHLGLDLVYDLTPSLQLWFSYVYSRMYDLYEYNQTRRLDYDDHHNFFLGLSWEIREDQHLRFMWGEYANYLDPTYWHLSAVDTQHLFRLVYEKDF